ncbi:MAG: aldehyde ferredoxin oxidoreductase family protein [Candidatus Bathyarchaeota archaeon]|nr:aldehyde ferredoxin oxidoreductase family protein [Candidatus Bathyarchaeota archaeon]
MKGWTGRLLRVDLTKGKAVHTEYSEELAKKFIGGRGLAVKILWDELKPGTDPLGPDNILIFAGGLYAGLPAVNSGKMVVAAKSPLTGGYGDGNLGTMASPNMRKAGLDGIVFTGKAKKPTYLWINDDQVEFKSAADLWGLDSYETEKRLKKEHGATTGVLTIGQSGENLSRFSTVVSQEGRSGGRPGMGAVMGSKNLKAVIIKGTGEIPVADMDALKKMGREDFQDILKRPNYKHWKAQGTMATVEWCQAASTLPTRNFREGVFDHSKEIDGNTMEATTVKQRGCPNCNMICGNVILDTNGEESELDYENVVMLGSNIGVGDLKQVGRLNRMCDMLGLDTISAGSALGFAMECSEKKLVKGLKLDWGDFEGSQKLIEDIAYMRGHGALFGMGTKAAAEKIGGDSMDFAMQVKGLECSAYDCHLCPGMSLSFGTSPIGAHHKDAWVISWEISSGTREEYGPAKADKVIEFQRIRGGMFECLVACRFPWIELGFEVDHYPKYMEAATGLKWSLDDMWALGDRVYALIRAFWVREFAGKWDREMDYPPERWFKEPLTEGPLAGKKLDKAKYDALLGYYYEKRGWDNRGIPTKATMNKLGLGKEAEALNKVVKLK